MTTDTTTLTLEQVQQWIKNEQDKLTSEHMQDMTLMIGHNHVSLHGMDLNFKFHCVTGNTPEETLAKITAAKTNAEQLRIKAREMLAQADKLERNMN